MYQSHYFNNPKKSSSDNRIGNNVCVIDNERCIDKLSRGKWTSVCVHIYMYFYACLNIDCKIPMPSD